MTLDRHEWRCANCGEWRDEDEPECPWCGDDGLEPYVPFDDDEGDE